MRIAKYRDDSLVAEVPDAVLSTALRPPPGPLFDSRREISKSPPQLRRGALNSPPQLRRRLGGGAAGTGHRNVQTPVAARTSTLQKEAVTIFCKHK